MGGDDRHRAGLHGRRPGLLGAADDDPRHQARRRSSSPATTPTSANIAVQARKLGITVPFLGGDGWDSAQLAEIGGDAIEGSYYSNHYSPDEDAPRGPELRQEVPGRVRRRCPTASPPSATTPRCSSSTRIEARPIAGRQGARRGDRRDQGLPRRHRHHHDRRAPQRQEVRPSSSQIKDGKPAYVTTHRSPPST